jgi:hypothetical protein
VTILWEYIAVCRARSSRKGKEARTGWEDYCTCMAHADFDT